MTQPYDELECVGGPCDGERLKIPVGAKRIAAPRKQDGVRWFEPGVYERTRGDQVDCLVWHREGGSTPNPERPGSLSRAALVLPQQERGSYLRRASLLPT